MRWNVRAKVSVYMEFDSARTRMLLEPLQNGIGRSRVYSEVELVESSQTIHICG